MDKNKINRRDFLAGAVTLAAVAGCRSPKMTSATEALYGNVLCKAAVQKIVKVKGKSK